MKKKLLHRWMGILMSSVLAGTLMLSGCSKSEEGNADAQTESDTSQGDAQAPQTEDENTVFGQIAEIGEEAITVALAERPQRAQGEAPSGERPEMPEGETGSGEEPPQKPQEGEEQENSSEASSEQETSGEASEEETPGEPPQGEAPQDGEMPEGEPPEGAGQMELNLTGEEQEIPVTESTTYTIDGEEGTLEDLEADDIVTIILADDGTAQSVQSGMGGGMGGRGGGPQGESQDGSEESQEETESVDTAGANEVTDTQTLDGVLKSATAEESVVVVKDGGNLTLEDATVTKTGDASDTEKSEFYGLNAALLTKEGSTMTVTGTDITTQAEGANAIFATGEDAVISVQNVTIKTTGNSSRGLDATHGGTVTADQVTIGTFGAHCAAVATDRGEGTITVDNSNLQTAGEGSPCVYSTGNITVSNTEGKATGSSMAVVEGKNSITLQNCDFVCAGTGRANGGIDDAGVMVYQSMSGDAGEGTGNFSAAESELSINEESEQYETAPMFFVTNTDAVITLEDTELNFGSGILLNASGNDGEWGEAGANGGTVALNGQSQILEGDITADEISAVTVNLTASVWEGAANPEQETGEITVNLDADSTWEVTGDSYVSVLTNEDETCENISSNGYTVYYDAFNEANAWLNGQTIALEGGGSIAPGN